MIPLIHQHGDKPISPWGDPPILRIGARDFDTATIPELVRLRGVPQVAQHHPEVDTFAHVLMAMRQARLLTSEPAVHFATLMHDLGKGATPADVLPHHYGHEEAGVPIVAEVCDRIGVPDDWRALALLVCEHHKRLHTIQQAKGPGRRRLLRRIGAYENPERCEFFILACEADARGRLGLERRDYPQSGILRDTFARRTRTE